MTLVPAVLALLGRRAWWLPGWLDGALPDRRRGGRGAAPEGRRRAVAGAARGDGGARPRPPGPSGERPMQLAAPVGELVRVDVPGDLRGATSGWRRRPEAPAEGDVVAGRRCSEQRGSGPDHDMVELGLHDGRPGAERPDRQQTPADHGRRRRAFAAAPRRPGTPPRRDRRRGDAGPGGRRRSEGAGGPPLPGSHGPPTDQEADEPSPPRRRRRARDQRPAAELRHARTKSPATNILQHQGHQLTNFGHQRTTTIPLCYDDKPTTTNATTSHQPSTTTVRPARSSRATTASASWSVAGPVGDPGRGGPRPSLRRRPRGRRPRGGLRRGDVSEHGLGAAL